MELPELIELFRGPLIGLIASWGVPWTDATEIAQDSFAEAWLCRESCWGDWSDSELFGRFLRGIAKNRFRNWRRSKIRRLQLHRLAETSELELAGQSRDIKADPRMDALRLAIDRLPIRYRQVILMHYLDDSSVREVAALLSVSIKTVEGRLYQARRSLKRQLSDAGFSIADMKGMLLCLLS